MRREIKVMEGRKALGTKVKERRRDEKKREKKGKRRREERGESRRGEQKGGVEMVAVRGRSRGPRCSLYNTASDSRPTYVHRSHT